MLNWCLLAFTSTPNVLTHGAGALPLDVDVVRHTFLLFYVELLFLVVEVVGGESEPC